MGNKGLFPGVAVPLAFFCTLFFRHRKKSVSVPWDGKSQSAPESARQAPPGQGYAPAGALGAFRSPPVPFGSPLEAIERPIGLQALLPRRSRRVSPHHGGLLSAKASPNVAGRGLSSRQKQSALPALAPSPLRQDSPFPPPNSILRPIPYSPLNLPKELLHGH